MKRNIIIILMWILSINVACQKSGNMIALETANQVRISIPQKNNGQRIYYSWEQLVESNNALKNNCKYINIIEEFSNKESIDPYDICKIANINNQLKENFIEWWNCCERQSEILVTPDTNLDSLNKELDLYSKSFLDAIIKYANKDDIPFLIYLENHMNIIYCSLSNSYEVIPKIIEKDITDDSIFGFLLLTLEIPYLSTNTRNMLYSIIGKSQDVRSLPTLVKCSYGLLGQYRYSPDEKIVNTIYLIDPKQDIIKLYFNYCEQIAEHYNYVSAEIRRARSLKLELDKKSASQKNETSENFKLQNNNNESSVNGRFDKIVLNKYNFSIQIPNEWQISNSNIPEAPQAFVTLEHHDEIGMGYWIAFSIFELSKDISEFEFSMIYSEKGNIQNANLIGMGEEDIMGQHYDTKCYYPERQIINKSLYACTYAIGDSENRISLVILTMADRKKAGIGFFDTFKFAFKYDLTMNGEKIKLEL